MNALRTRGWLLVLWLGSVVVRIGYAWWLFPHWLAGDAGDYWAEASRWIAGQPPGIYWPPGLPLWLALVRSLLGSAPWVAVLASLLLWSLLFEQMAWLSRGASPRRRLALLGLFSLYPAFIHQSVVPLSHLPVACLLLALLGGLQLAPSPSRAAWLGGILGLAALFRPGTLALGPFLLGWWLWSSPRRTWTSRGMVVLLFLLGCALPILGWRQLAPELRAQRALINTATPYNVFIGNQPETPHYRSWWLGSHQEREDAAFASYYARLDSIRALPTHEQSQAWLAEAWRQVRDAPGTFARRVWNRSKVFWAFDTLAGASLSRSHPLAGRLLVACDAAAYLLLMTLVLTRWVAGDGREGIWLGLTLAYMLPYLLAFSHPTYHLPILPVLGLWALRQPRASLPQGKRRWAWVLVWLSLLAIQVEWGLSWLS
jgi:hypothetical protein